jgi:integrase
MAKRGFSDPFLKSLKPREKRYTVYEQDGRFEGFVVDVLPSGKLSFRYRYRLNGKREKVTIGNYPGMSLTIARERYRAMVEAVHRGVSPAEQKKHLGSNNDLVRTFESLAKDWIRDDLRPANKNARQDETYIMRDVLPLLGKKAPADIDRAAVWKCIETVRARGYGQAARRVLSVVKRVFDYAISRGEINVNPAQSINPRHIAPAGSRKRILKPDEIPAWLHAVETSSIPRSTKLALRLLLLIPLRKGELLAAKWCDVDLTRRTWDIPAGNSKNGAPIRHRLSDHVASILTELKQLSAGSDWVLPSTRGYGKKPVSKSGINTAVRGIKGWPEGFVIHDLRRTVRTYLTELGVPTNVAELCLNHRPTGIVKVYDQAELLDQRYQALLRWESHMEALTLPETLRPTREVSAQIDKFIQEIRGDEVLKRYIVRELLAGE